MSNDKMKAPSLQQLSDALPEYANWTDELTPDIACHLWQSALAQQASEPVMDKLHHDKERLRGVLFEAETDRERDKLKALIKDIKNWDIDQFLSIPQPIRARMQSALGLSETQVQQCTTCGGAVSVHSPDGEYRGECPFCSEPAQVSQPVAYGDKLGTHLQCVYAIPSTGTPVWMLAMTPLYASPPDYEALKDENEALKLRVAELEEAQLAKVVMLENTSKADARLINSADSLIQSMRLEAETLKSRVAELEAATEHLGLTPQQAKDGLARYKAERAERDKLQKDCAALKENVNYLTITNTALKDLACSARSRLRDTKEELGNLKLRVAELEDSNLNKHYLSRIEKLNAANITLQTQINTLSNKCLARNLSIGDYTDAEYVQAYMESHFERFDEVAQANIELQSECNIKQAKIDSLMFEYCPMEMTFYQKVDYEKHQRRSDIAIPTSTKGQAK